MLLDGKFGHSAAEDDDAHQHGQDEIDSALGPGHAHAQRETKHWQEGWYIWWSSSRWAAQEKLDLMRRDLEGQTEWQRLKDSKNDEWSRGLPPHEPTPGDHQAQDELYPFQDMSNTPPFPDVS